ncbi:MAG: FkbM family methyltransferase [Chitinophagales bacterium]
MGGLKKLFLSIFGLRNYLRFVSASFFILYRLGILRSNKKFDCHYYIHKLVKEGDHIIDIGANMGYYTVLFSDIVKEQGKVYAVEPVELYRKILLKNIGRRKNVEIIPFALGNENKDEVGMGIPGNDISRHGLTRITEKSSNNQAKTFSVSMRNPLELFSAIPKLDYIKIDVEGYEMHIVPVMLPLIDKYHPILQIEATGENKMLLISMLNNIGYKTFFVSGREFISVPSAGDAPDGDLFFVYQA